MQTHPLSAQPTKLRVIELLSQFFKLSPIFSYRFSVFLRFLIAIVGGYSFTAASTALLSFLLPLTKSDAVLLCVSLSILIYALVFIYAFYIKSLKTVWISILLTTSAQICLLAVLKGWL
ncbi:hypothetical protein [Pseudoalteromonas fuliginea]|uniref:Iron transporter n=1 Tax=Pseudoalteromonas fuliginea TaxID=1872678 RepID=A0ABQ6RDY8_9GAMM|nr:hypothetical protein [Pseudoalteromonas fuliginea]KAA1150959.1 hypothetical protein EU509_17800 [Pseudoalteromonas fuliginea]KAA1165632.1 hypothetical protein EUZ79_17790 [Pseudoalteromonas fuliginea]